MSRYAIDMQFTLAQICSISSLLKVLLLTSEHAYNSTEIILQILIFFLLINQKIKLYFSKTQFLIFLSSLRLNVTV